MTYKPLTEIRNGLEYFIDSDELAIRPETCERDNTHEQNHTCCQPCWNAGFRTVAPATVACNGCGVHKISDVTLGVAHTNILASGYCADCLIADKDVTA